MGSDSYIIERGEFGLRAILTSYWDASTERSLLNLPIAELELNRGKGWVGQDLSFLAHFPELLGIKIIGRTAESVAPIHSLHNLRALTVMTYCKTELRFSEFPKLIDCAIQWRAKAKSVFECLSLKKLFINGFSGSDTQPFEKLVNLESLGILGSPIRTLEGLSYLSQLRSLRLGALRKLASLKGLEPLELLEKLEINTCRSIGSIDELSALMNLRELHLDNMGDIQSLKPLSGLLRLQRLTFAESTNILDGDLSFLFGLPMLELISFKNRKHYSHRREEFQTIRHA
jgi:hypothetical protein